VDKDCPAAGSHKNLGVRSADSRGFGSDPYIPQKRISDNLPVLTPPARGTYRNPTLQESPYAIASSWVGFKDEDEDLSGYCLWPRGDSGSR
jgi:hypothetical protein